jgi:hypothetical protein
LSAYLKSSMHTHWKLLGLIAVIVIAMASTVYAYWRINAPSFPTSYATATLPPLELSAELDKTEFQQGETIQIRFHLKNIDKKPVRIAFAYQNFIFGFIVENENSTKVFLHPVMLVTTLEDVILEPSDQLGETQEWVQEYNQDPACGEPFKPGIYKIIGCTGTFYLAEGDWSETSTLSDISWGPLSQIETPPITIVIS